MQTQLAGHIPHGTRAGLLGEAAGHAKNSEQVTAKDI